MSETALEKRVQVLERELAKLKSTINGAGSQSPWWERIAGSFEQDAAYKSAMKLGRDYRRSQLPEAK